MSQRSKVGVFLFNGYQELEFWYPVLRLREAELDVTVIGVENAEAAYSLLGYPVVPNIALAQASAGEYRALVLPGGKVSGIAENAALSAFLQDAKSKGAVLAAASQAARLLPGSGNLVARTTDEVPQWLASILKELQK